MKISICVPMYQAAEAYLKQFGYNITVIDTYRGETGVLEAEVQGKPDTLRRLLKDLGQEEIVIEQ